MSLIVISRGFVAFRKISASDLVTVCGSYRNSQTSTSQFPSFAREICAIVWAQIVCQTRMLAISEAFITLLLRHENELRGLIGACVFDAQEREDVFQEVAMTLWRRHGDFDASGSFCAWARGIAGNLILKNRSRRARAPAALAPEVL